ncbi:MAG: Gldg family protein [Lachnospiraceae bacterium]|nr:Gldg family protein [Lachnospiraceae bacterium]
MWAVFKKEWLDNFRTLSGWIFLAVTLFFTGWYFRYYGLERGMPYLSYILNAVLFIFIFTLPLLTMRSFAEEKKHHTDRLIFTAPVPAWKIVIGKYLAAVCVFAPVFLMFLAYPLILGIYGDVPPAENLLAVASFFFFGLAAIAVGILISALTENQIVAAVLSFFVLLLSTMISSISSMISSEGNIVTRSLAVFDLSAPFDRSLYGTFCWPDFVYYLSVAGLALFFTDYILTARRFHLRTFGILGAFESILKAGLLLFVVIGLNLFVHVLPPQVQNIDLTYNGIHSLTDPGREVLSALDQGVQIFVLAAEDEADETIAYTLKRMQEETGYLKVDYIDPVQHPEFYLSYTDTEPVPNSLIVCCGSRVRVVDYYECFQLRYDYAYDVTSGSYIATDYTVSGYDGEGRIIAAIRYVVSDHVPKIYCVNGHDEYEPEEELKSRILNANYELEGINLLLHDEIPEDGDALLLLAPFEDLNEDDLGKIQRFLDKGKGAVCVTACTEGEEPENYHALLRSYGVEVLPGVVTEEDPAFYNSSGEFLLPEIVKTEYTASVYSEDRTRFIYMPFSRGLRVQETPDVTSQTFLRTGEEAYIQTDTLREEGPFSLGIFSVRYLAKGESRMAVFATDYFLYQDINRAVNGSNYELFMKVLGEVSETAENTDIPVKGYAYDPILVGNGVRGFFSVLFIGVIPAALLFSGIGIWYYRRKN